MIIAIPIYQGVNLLDVAGPLEMFSWAEGIAATLVSADGGPVTSINKVTFQAQASFAQLPAPDVLWVPGGATGALALLMTGKDQTYIEYLRQAGATATWVCSVCEGALLLAQAGLLDGHQITTHWDFVNCFGKFPQVHVVEGTPRFVQSGNRLTGGGISSGLDEALKLIELLTGTANAITVQQTTQYFPAPPVQSTLPSPSTTCPFSW
jgi:transcriptional regulator GlxA family with amidase domain